MTEKNLNNQLNDQQLDDVTGGLRTDGLASGTTAELMNGGLTETLTEGLTSTEGIASTETLTSAERLANATRIAANGTVMEIATENVASTATEALTSNSRMIII